MARKRKVFFEVPYSMEPPRLTHDQVGLHRVLTRSDGTFSMLTTLLDTPDHRLLRAGILLAHRVQDGLGEWYLDAPGWSPWLPSDHGEPMGAAGDLPDDLAELVRPFRRRAALGPVAAVSTERHTYALKDADEVSLGTIRDEKKTIRRNGLTIARFREVAILPSPAMSGAQRRWLVEAIRQVGGTQVDAFPHLVTRIGAPATGPTDFPEPREWDSRVSLEIFVSQLFATRLQEVVRADLALRASELARRDTGEEPPGCASLLSELTQLRHQISSLAGVLEPAWRAGVEADLNAVLSAEPERAVTALSERYFSVLDALVSAVRAPQLGHRSSEPAAPVLRGQLESGIRILMDRCDKLGPASAESDWEGALVASRQLLGTTEGLGILFGKLSRKVAKQLRKTQRLLEPCQPVEDWPSEEELASWTTTQVFEAGRALQRAGDARDAARAEFVREWPTVRSKLWAIRRQS